MTAGAACSAPCGLGEGDTATPWDPGGQDCPGVCHKVSEKAPWRPACGFPIFKWLIKKEEIHFYMGR